tara:strand:+ start:2027 stop:2140 length:114 start_codon:yes stop_codon:yes gene_type:complete
MLKKIEFLGLIDMRAAVPYINLWLVGGMIFLPPCRAI